MKKLLLYLLGIALTISPLFVFSQDSIVIKGFFDDGAVIAYQCQGTTGVKFFLKTPEGAVYSGMLACGEVI